MQAHCCNAHPRTPARPGFGVSGPRKSSELHAVTRLRSLPVSASARADSQRVGDALKTQFERVQIVTEGVCPATNLNGFKFSCTEARGITVHICPHESERSPQEGPRCHRQNKKRPR